jgi:hypothetical protein
MLFGRLGKGFGKLGGAAGAGEGGVGGGAASTWSSANKGTNIVLSNGDKTASKAAGGDWNCVIGTTSKNTGKHYFEIRLDAKGSDDQYGLFGIALNDQNYNSYLTASGGAACERIVGSLELSSAPFAINGRGHASQAAGKVFSVAIDLVAGKAWFGISNAYGGDPVAGTSPWVTWTPGAQEIFPAFGANEAAGTITVTLRTALADQTHAPPTGFTAWG